MERKKAVAVITARGGSKRIPHKNVKEFCGKPMIEYSISAALKSGVFDEVMVSTDDSTIAGIAEKAGAKVPFMRSKRNAGDMAATHEVILEVLESYKKMGNQFEYICCIYPTAPFLTEEKLKESMRYIEEFHADEVIPVVAYSFPPQRCFVIRNGRVQFQWPENRLKRSQDLETYYHDCGQFYFLRTDAFIREKSMLLENTVPMILDEMEVQDIDNQKDWEIAEMKFRLQKRKQEKNDDIGLP